MIAPRHTGDYYGQAPYLWCTVALSENNEYGQLCVLIKIIWD